MIVDTPKDTDESDEGDTDEDRQVGVKIDTMNLSDILAIAEPLFTVLCRPSAVLDPSWKFRIGLKGKIGW